MSANERLVLLTGTSSGIGAALAKALLARQWTVIGLARRPVHFENSGYRHLRIDLTDLERLRDVTEAALAPIIVESRWTRVGLVNNAAIPGRFQLLEETDPLALARVFAVNTVAPIFLMALMTRLVPRHTPLRIVNLSTGAAQRGLPGIADYGSSKAALRLAGMTLAAELESQPLPDGTRRDAGILSYEPGVVDTQMQNAAREADPTSFPSSHLFHTFAEQGLLQPPQAVLGEMIGFLEGDIVEFFTERRFARPE